MRHLNSRLVPKREGTGQFLRNTPGKLRFAVIHLEDSYAHKSLACS